MRREIAQIILVVLTLSLLLVSTTLAQGTTVSIDPSLVQDHDIKPGAPIMGSYPSDHNETATVTNPTYAYDNDQLTSATVSPPSTTWVYFNVKTFNSTLTKEYIALDLSLNFSVVLSSAYYRFILYVGSKSTNLQLMNATSFPTPTVRTWAALPEPNDGLWNQTDINNMVFRVEVRKATAGGSLTFQEYEVGATIPADSFTVRVNVAEVTALVSWQVNITFNPAVLQAIIAWEGPFLKQLNPPGTTFLTPAIDNSAGWITAGAVLKNYNYGGVTGSGTLATVCFKAIGQGNSVLHLDEETTKLRTWDGSTLVPIEHTTVSGFFQYLIGDANNDGAINVFDILAIKSRWGSTPANPDWIREYDVNNDDAINVFDILTIKAHWGESW